MARGIALFSTYDLRGVLENHRHKGEQEIGSLTGPDLLPDNESAVLQRFIDEYSVAPLELVPDGITAEQEDADVDVSHDRSRYFRGPGPHYIRGQLVRYYVPYRGDRKLWECHPSAYTTTSPAASRLTDDELVFEFRTADNDIAATKRGLDSKLGSIRQYLEWSGNDIAQHNNSLMQSFRSALARRRDVSAKTQAGIESLGIPIRNKPTPPPPPVNDQPALAGGKRAKGSPRRKRFDYDVALSFAGEDRAYVDQVAAALKARDVEVFYDKYEKAALWGKNLADHLGDVYGKRSRFVVLFASKYYPLKSWPEHERQSAQARAIREGESVLLPARFDDTEIAGLPSTVAFVDLREHSPTELADLIFQKLKSEG